MSLEKMSDEELMELAQQNSNKDDVFNILYQRYEKRIFYFIKSLSSDSNNLEDVSQEVFVRLYKNFDSYRYAGSFKKWLFKIAKNTTYSYFRNKDTERNLLNRTLDVSNYKEFVASFSNREREIIGEEEISNLEKCLQSLPRYCREVLTLIYLEENSTEAVHFKLGLTPGTVRSYKFRGLNKLRENLSKNSVY